MALCGRSCPCLLQTCHPPRPRWAPLSTTCRLVPVVCTKEPPMSTGQSLSLRPWCLGTLAGLWVQEGLLQAWVCLVVPPPAGPPSGWSSRFSFLRPAVPQWYVRGFPTYVVMVSTEESLRALSSAPSPRSHHSLSHRPGRPVPSHGACTTARVSCLMGPTQVSCLQHSGSDKRDACFSLRRRSPAEHGAGLVWPCCTSIFGYAS